MGIFGNLFGRSQKSNNKKNNNKSKKRRTRSNSISYQKKNSNKYANLNKKEYSLSAFQNKFGDSHPKFKRVVKADLVIMFDPDAPHGENSSKKKENKTYIHYLQVKDDIILPYEPPNPPNGTHNYYTYSMKCRNKKIKEKLRKLQNSKTRTPEILQKLNSESTIDDWKIIPEFIVRKSHFKITNKSSKNSKKTNKK